MTKVTIEQMREIDEPLAMLLEDPSTPAWYKNKFIINKDLCTEQSGQ